MPKAISTRLIPFLAHRVLIIVSRRHISTAIPTFDFPAYLAAGGNECKTVYLPELRTDSERTHRHYRRLGIPHSYRGEEFDSKIPIRAPEHAVEDDMGCAGRCRCRRRRPGICRGRRE